MVKRARGVFTSPNTVDVRAAINRRRSGSRTGIIATGSLPVVPKPWVIGDDPRRGQHRRATAARHSEEVAGHRWRVPSAWKSDSVYAALGEQSHGGRGARTYPLHGRQRPRRSARTAAEDRVRGDLHQHESHRAWKATKDGIVVKLEGRGVRRHQSRSTGCWVSGRSPARTPRAWVWTRPASTRTNAGSSPSNKQRRDERAPHLRHRRRGVRSPDWHTRATAEARALRWK